MVDLRKSGAGIQSQKHTGDTMLVPIEPKTSIDAEELCLAPWLLPLIDAARKGDSIIEPLQCLVQSMGFGTFLYAVGTSKKLQHDERFYLWTTVPAEWIAEYDRNSYVEIDPRVRYGWSMWPPPLLWDKRLLNHSRVAWLPSTIRLGRRKCMPWHTRTNFRRSYHSDCRSSLCRQSMKPIF